jgi:hypothetical protein
VRCRKSSGKVPAEVLQSSCRVPAKFLQSSGKVPASSSKFRHSLSHFSRSPSDMNPELGSSIVPARFQQVSLQFSHSDRLSLRQSSGKVAAKFSKFRQICSGKVPAKFSTPLIGSGKVMYLATCSTWGIVLASSYIHPCRWVGQAFMPPSPLASIRRCKADHAVWGRHLMSSSPWASIRRCEPDRAVWGRHSSPPSSRADIRRCEADRAVWDKHSSSLPPLGQHSLL